MLIHSNKINEIENHHINKISHTFHMKSKLANLSSKTLFYKSFLLHRLFFFIKEFFFWKNTSCRKKIEK